MKKYTFEENKFTRTERQIVKSFGVFKERIGVVNLPHDTSPFITKIKTFLSLYIGNIEWYDKNIAKNEKRVKIYLWISYSLIIIIPFFILLITFLIAELNTPSKTLQLLVSGITAVITSLMGLHKVITSWLEKRKILSIFHESSSTLKTLLYSFEDKWNSEPVLQGSTQLPTKEFDDALEEIIKNGRKVVNDERQKYFEIIESPNISLSNILSSSFTEASGLIVNFQSRRLKWKLEEQEEERIEMKQKVKLRSDIAALEREIIGLNSRLNSLKTDLSNAGPVDKPAIQSRINTIIASIDLKQIELINKKSKV